MDEFSTRLVELLEYLNIRSAELAEKMGVQRTSFNHLLSGRNKPGFEFLHRLHTTYPSVNLTWLITGSGSIEGQDDAKFSPAKNSPPQTQQEPDLFSNIFNPPAKPDLHEEPSEKQDIFQVRSGSSNEQEIERLIIVYKSGRMVEIKH